MKYSVKGLASTAALLCGVGLVGTATPAHAFWVNELYFQANPFAQVNKITKEVSVLPKDGDQTPPGPAIRQDGAHSKVFLNEVDPTAYVDDAGVPLSAIYEIAAPNGSDLSKWTFAVYQGNSETQKAYLMREYSFSELSNRGIFTDQQQGWGFGTIASRGGETPIDGKISLPVKSFQGESNINAHYAIINDKHEVVQVLAYRDEAVLQDGPARGYVSTSIYGMSDYNRRGMYAVKKNRPINGSWKLNNVFLEPDSTYGSLKRGGIEGYKLKDIGFTKDGLAKDVNGELLLWHTALVFNSHAAPPTFPDSVKWRADELIQWYTPRKFRTLETATDISNTAAQDRWGQINFLPDNKAHIGDLGVGGMEECISTEFFTDFYGKDACAKYKLHNKYQAPGDEGYLFDVHGRGQDKIPSIPNKVLKGGNASVSIKITDDPWAREHLSIVALPLDKEFSPSMVATMPKTQRTSGLPAGIHYNPQTGVLSGVAREPFNLRFIVSSNNLNPDDPRSFHKTGHNGHGITYRTFFMRTENHAPIIQTDNYPVLKGIEESTRVIISDPDNDIIERVTITGPKGGPLPAGVTVDTTTNPYHPVIRISKATPIGDYPLVITATDKPAIGPGLTTVKDYTLVVNDNRPPRISLPPLTFEQGTAHTVQAEVKDPDIGDKIVKAFVTTADGKPIPGVTFDVSNPAAPKITIGKNTEIGEYRFTLTADDRFGPANKGRDSVTGTISITPTTSMTAPALTAPFGKRAHVAITVKGEHHGTFQTVPVGTAVPSGLNIVRKGNELQLETNGQTPIGVYKIGIRETRTKLVVPVTVHITPSSKVPYPMVRDHVIVTGRKTTLPFHIHAVGQTRVTMTLKGSNYETLNQYQYNGAFTLDTRDMARPVIRVAKDVHPGRYIIKLVASDVAQPSIRGEALMSVTVLSEADKPIITLDHQTLVKQDKNPVAFDLKIVDPNRGYIKASIQNRTQVPRGIYIRPMSDGTGTNALIISSIVPQGTYPVTVDVRNSYGATGTKTFMVKVTDTSIEVQAK